MSDGALADALVGRRRERDRLSGWVAELARGTGRAVLVEGEPGIGKTSLVRWVAAEARQAGCEVFWGACDELSGAFPLLPLLDALGVGEVATDQRRRAIVQTLRAGSAPDTAIDRAAEAAEQVLSLVDELCEVSPVLLVVDDLQWADAATVLTWGRLARSVRQLPLLLVGMIRPVPQRDDIGVLRRVVNPGGLIRLSGLSEREVDCLLERTAGGRPGSGLRRLAEGATGNPLYLTELVDALTRGHRLLADGDVVDVTRGPTPDSLPAVIADRLEFLSASARGVLRSAAMLGVEFSVSQLAMVSGRPLTELLPALDEATAAGVVRDDGVALAFRHPLIRTALYDAIPAGIRAAWHLDVGRALAEHGAPVESVARQLMPALDDAETGRGEADRWVVGWLVEAGQQLVGQAPQAAIPLLRWAMTGTPAGTRERHVVACLLAEALFRAGDATQAAQVATHALEQVTDPDLLVDLHWTLTTCRVAQGHYEEPLADLERALAAPGVTPRHRARLLVLIARIHRNCGRVDTAARIATEALAEATAVGDRVATGGALSVLAMARTLRGDTAEALPLFERGLAVAEGEPALADMRLLLQINYAGTLAYLDRYDEAIAAARQAQQLADRAGNTLRLTQAETLLGEMLYELGRWDEALAEVGLPDTEATGAKNPHVECYRHGVAATIKLHCGGDSAPHFAATEPLTAQIGNRVNHNLALARSLRREQAGAPAQALGVLMEALKHTAEEPAETADLLADAVRLALAENDRSVAQAVTARAEALLPASNTANRRGTALHCRGLLEHDPVPLLQAAEFYQKAGRPLPRAQAFEAAGAAFADRGDITAARAAFTDAFAVYTTLGATWDLARTQARFRAYGIRRGPVAKHRRVDRGWESLTPTEAKITMLVAQGLSNPQIAAQLFLSRRTVQGHVSHILNKLDVRSRMDITREATLRKNTATT